MTASDVATKLYPHQKKALTFLLDREHEKPAGDNFASLWKKEMDPMSGHLVWVHVVTKEQVYQEPKESKGSILADDVRLLSPLLSLVPTDLNPHVRWGLVRPLRASLLLRPLFPRPGLSQPSP